MEIKEKKIIKLNEAEIKTLRATAMIWNKANEFVQQNKLRFDVDFEGFVEKGINQGEIDVNEE